jgi:hypothetical protein
MFSPTISHARRVFTFYIVAIIVMAPAAVAEKDPIDAYASAKNGILQEGDKISDTNP